jgi:hypothetical protein
MEARIEAIHTISVSLCRDFHLISDEYSRYLESLKGLSRSLPVPLRRCVKIPNPSSSGMTESGTQYSSLLSLSTSITSLLASLDTFSSSLLTNFSEVNVTESDHLALDELTTSRDSFLTFLTELLPESCKTQSPQKIAQLLTAIQRKGRPTKSESKKLQQLVVEALSERGKSAQAQTSLTACGLEKLRHFNTNAAKLSVIAQARIPIMHSLLSAVPLFGQPFVADIRAAAQQLRAAADAIDFVSDFKSFVENNQIIRYDIPCPQFVPIDISHPGIPKIDARVRIPQPQFYPKAMAVVREDFIPKGGNEIAIQRGKHVLVIDDLGPEWVFVFNPINKTIGYVPKICLEALGENIGVVLGVGVATKDAGFIQRGEYVCVREVGKVEVDALTITGKNAKIRKDLVRIISV